MTIVKVLVYETDSLVPIDSVLYIDLEVAKKHQSGNEANPWRMVIYKDVEVIEN